MRARNARDLVRDQHGSVMIIAALAMLALAGFAGLAIDGSSLYFLKARLQATADTAALAAVTRLPNETQALATAMEYSGKNMLAAEHGQVLANADVAVGNWNGGTQTFTPGGNPVNAVSVTTRRATANDNAAIPNFLSLFGIESVDITAQAVSAAIENTLCILSLDPSAAGAMSLDSNASIDASGCTVQVNSGDPAALGAGSTSSITAESICVTGDYDHAGTGTYSPAPDAGCAPMPDPLGALDPPAYSGCDYNNTYLDDATVTLSPGVYCGGLHIDGNSIITLDPGVYVVKDADFHVDSNSSIQGDGVGFYLTNDATLHFDSNTQVSLSAPTMGPMAGLLIFQDRADSGTHSIDSNAVAKLEGTIYLPNGVLSSDSNSSITGSSAFTIVIARQIILNSNATLVLNDDYEASDIPLPGELASTGSLVD